MRPGLAGLVTARQVLTPLDLERDYGLTGGHPMHGEHGARPVLPVAAAPRPRPLSAGARRAVPGGRGCAPGWRRHRTDRPERRARDRRRTGSRAAADGRGRRRYGIARGDVRSQRGYAAAAADDRRGRRRDHERLAARVAPRQSIRRITRGSRTRHGPDAPAERRPSRQLADDPAAAPRRASDPAADCPDPSGVEHPRYQSVQDRGSCDRSSRATGDARRPRPGCGRHRRGRTRPFEQGHSSRRPDRRLQLQPEWRRPRPSSRGRLGTAGRSVRAASDAVPSDRLQFDGVSGPQAGRAAARQARRPGPPRLRQRPVPRPKPLQQPPPGQVEVDRRDRDPAVDDGVEVRPLDGQAGRRRTADPEVGDAARVERARSARPGRRACRGGSPRSRRTRSSGTAGTLTLTSSPGDSPCSRMLRATVVAARAGQREVGVLVVLLRDREGRAVVDDRLHRRADRARVGDVVAQVRAVVDARRRRGRSRGRSSRGRRG